MGILTIQSYHGAGARGDRPNQAFIDEYFT
jgi:hypothetical protein